MLISQSRYDILDCVKKIVTLDSHPVDVNIFGICTRQIDGGASRLSPASGFLKNIRQKRRNSIFSGGGRKISDQNSHQQYPGGSPGDITSAISVLLKKHATILTISLLWDCRAQDTAGLESHARHEICKSIAEHAIPYPCRHCSETF